MFLEMNSTFHQFLATEPKHNNPKTKRKKRKGLSINKASKPTHKHKRSTPPRPGKPAPAPPESPGVEFVTKVGKYFMVTNIDSVDGYNYTYRSLEQRLEDVTDFLDTTPAIGNIGVNHFGGDRTHKGHTLTRVVVDIFCEKWNGLTNKFANDAFEEAKLQMTTKCVKLLGYLFRWNPDLAKYAEAKDVGKKCDYESWYVKYGPVAPQCQFFTPLTHLLINSAWLVISDTHLESLCKVFIKAWPEIIYTDFYGETPYEQLFGYRTVYERQAKEYGPEYGRKKTLKLLFGDHRGYVLHPNAVLHRWNLQPENNQ